MNNEDNNNNYANSSDPFDRFGGLDDYTNYYMPELFLMMNRDVLNSRVARWLQGINFYITFF